MIKINKDYFDIPASLRLPNDRNLQGRRQVQKAATTHTRCLKLIRKGEYLDQNIYNSRYKCEDIKQKLKDIYHNKCAYCETRIEQFHVEHYRPKRIYYWLAYSWDNLLLGCSTCNSNKGDDFEIKGNQVTFENTPENLSRIHEFHQEYNEGEVPKMVNPEFTNPEGLITFDRGGLIFSENDCFKYTIEKCKLDRADLNDQRRKILDVFRNDINAILLDAKSRDEFEIQLGVIIGKFKRDLEDAENCYLAFRKFIWDNNWLNEIVRECIG